MVTPAPIDAMFHIATAAEWADTKAVGEYLGSTRGQTLAEVGYMHCSYIHQVLPVANAIYSDCVDPLVLLEIDPELVGSPIRVESMEGGSEEFPHIYGPLAVAAVRNVFTFERTAAGSFALPPGVHT
jgi:uncharacterized protein (DUF952 family)